MKPSQSSISINSSIAILILAAGSSLRMRQSKQLLKVEGEPLLVRAADAAIQTGCTPVLVVLGANESLHRNAIGHLPLSIVSHPGWAKGMGSSIKVGMKHLLSQSPEIEGALIMVCDQPLVTASYLKTVISKFKDAPIIASEYANTMGVPALFSKAYFPELLQLNDDEGAKKIIQQNKQAVLSIAFGGGAIDLDTPQDYSNFIS